MDSGFAPRYRRKSGRNPATDRCRTAGARSRRRRSSRSANASRMIVSTLRLPPVTGCLAKTGCRRRSNAGPERRRDHPDLTLHLIGPLQTNKVAEAVALFDVIEVVDRPKLALALAREMAKQDRRLGCYIQVNTGEEPQKSGIPPAEADEFITFCRDECGLDIVGLMCIPPQDEEPAMHFALLRGIAARNDLAGLSMGMSGDFEEAVGFGATSVRVGSAIFGARDA